MIFILFVLSIDVTLTGGVLEALTLNQCVVQVISRSTVTVKSSAQERLERLRKKFGDIAGKSF